jgi:glycosyltransferase involved in cell wall biosynthesis
MSSGPAVSVVMPAYNAEKYVAEATESILKQTFSDFEFIIVDDGSTDDTGQILAEYAARDDRIKLLRNEHGGVAAAANTACHAARGRYIARMDADDISAPTRLEEQFRFLQAHPEVGVLGSNIEELHEGGKIGPVWLLPTEPRVIGWFLMFCNCIAQASVMMRRELFEQVGPYERLEAAEDYELWIRASAVTKIANLSEVLLQYRIVRDSLSRRTMAFQEDHATDLQCALMSDLLQRDVSRRTVEILRGKVDVVSSARFSELDAAAQLLAKLYWAYTRKARPNRSERADIAVEALLSFDRLATFASALSPLKGLRIRVRGMCFVAPALLKRSNVGRALRRAWLIATKGLPERRAQA